jgi:glycosyltransferase involved in cell wall biosynthesis
MSMEKVSLYIPCYNAAPYLKECLESVLRQSYKIDEILVIDDGSTDVSMEIAKDYPVRIIRHGRNKGLAAARNTALRESRNDLVASLDADCLAHPEWLERLTRCFAWEDIAGAGGRLVERNPSGLADKWRLAHMKQAWGDDILYDPPFLYGNNNVLRKDAVMKAGGYNEEFKTNYEDIDLSERIYKPGFRMVYDPAAVVEHLRRDTVRSVLRSYWLRQWYYRKYNELGKKGILRKTALCIGGSIEWMDMAKDLMREDLLRNDCALLLIDSALIPYCLRKDIKGLFKKAFLTGVSPHE